MAIFKMPLYDSEIPNSPFDNHETRFSPAVFTETTINEMGNKMVLNGLGVQVVFGKDVTFKVNDQTVKMVFESADRLIPRKISSLSGVTLAGNQHILYKGLYEGLDLVFSLNDGRLKSNLVVWDAHSLNRLNIRYEGAPLALDGNTLLVGNLWKEVGLLLTNLEGNPLEEPVWMELGKNTLSYRTGAEAPFVIDPDYSFLAFSSYMGGVGSDSVKAMDIDSQGNLYIVGGTGSSNFPIVNGYNATYGGGVKDVFLASFSPNGTLRWSTFFGGSGDDRGEAILVYESYLFIVGGTSSNNLPMINSYNSTYGGGTDAFVAAFYLNGSLYWSTYLGGSDYDYGFGIGLLGSLLVVSGQTFSTDFPIQVAAQPTYGGGGDAFLSSFSIHGFFSKSTYLGGSGNDYVQIIAEGENGKIFVGGSTSSGDFPLINAYNSTYGGNSDGFVGYINDLNDFIWFTYLGGSLNDHVADIVGNASGIAYIVGSTSSADFPVLNGNGLNGSSDAFVASFNASGILQWSTMIGGSGTESGSEIILDEVGNLYVAGTSGSADFPILNSYNSSYMDGTDYFLLSMDRSGGLLWSLILGGTFDEVANSLTISQGMIYVGGLTNSMDMPTVNSFNSTYGASFDVFLFATYDPLKDFDGDGIPNLYEYENGLNMTVDDANDDLDEDGMPNLYEYENGLDVTVNDANDDLDGDGMPNLYEYENGLNVSVNDANGDLDGDGIPNLYEYENGLNVT
ncbi:MAG: hypothetical protein D6732_03560, partial [Methanobacteriota archaeon]